MVQEQTVIIERICVVSTNLNLQFSTKVLGPLFLFQSLVRQIFLALRRKCKNFLLASTYSTRASSPSINIIKKLVKPSDAFWKNNLYWTPKDSWQHLKMPV